MKSILMLVCALTMFADGCSKREPIPTGGLVLWLKADAGVTINGTTVSHWADQSGNGNDAIQENPHRQPRLVRNALNGLPVLRFDGEDDRLGLMGSERMSQISLFLVFKIDSGATGSMKNSPLALGDIRGGGQVYGVGMQDPFTGNTPDSIFIYSGSSSLSVHIGAPNCAAFGKWNSANFVTDQTIWNTTSRVNGAEASTAPGGPANIRISFPLGNATGTGVGGIGGADDVDPGMIVAKCDIAEVIVYNTVLSDSLRRTVEQYIGAKYQLPPVATLGP